MHVVCEFRGFLERPEPFVIGSQLSLGTHLDHREGHACGLAFGEPLARWHRQ